MIKTREEGDKDDHDQVEGGKKIIRTWEEGGQR